MTNIRVICPRVDGKPGPSDSEFIYIEPWLDVLSSKYNIYFENDISGGRRLVDDKIIIIGSLPHSWSASMKRSIDGFMHIVVDKYIFQSSPLPLKLRSNYDAMRLVRSIYREFRPGLVLVNSKVMKSDFDQSLAALGIDASVEVFYHPVTRLSRRKGGVIRDHRNSSHVPEVLYDSLHSCVGIRLRKVNSAMHLLRLLALPYDKPIDILENRNIVALLNIRPSLLSSLRKVFVRPSSMKLFIRALFFDFASRLLVVFSIAIRRRALEDPRYTDLNSRWKPSTKASAAMAMGIAYIGIDEAANREFSELYGVHAYFASSTLGICSVVKDFELGMKQSLFCDDQSWRHVGLVNSRLVDLVDGFARRRY